jgi:hypothetical protein
MLAVTALLLWIGSGCAKTSSSDVNPSQIYTAYEATYRYGGAGYPADSATPILKVTATFNVAGSTGTYVQLDGQSQVSVNGSVLTENEDIINQVTYVREKDGASDSDAGAAFSFVYTDNDGKQYQNTLTLPPPALIANAAGSIYSLSSALRVYWSASTAVASSETLIAYLEKVDGTYVVSSQSDASSGTAGQIVIDVTSLQPATPGAALLSVCRSRYGSPAQAPAAGGSITVTRCSPKVPVTLQ